MTEIDDSLTIIVPTIGRSTIKDTLESIAIQIEMFDQVFVIGDGVYPNTRNLIATYGVQYAYFEISDGPHHDWGAKARNFGIDLAKKAYISFMDDDDYYSPEAFKAIKNAIRTAPRKPFMFRMQHGNQIIWKRREIAIGNVSSQMFVVPNIPEKLGRFSDRYEGDFDFIRDTRNLYSKTIDPFIWREEVISVLHKANGKPDESPLSTLELPSDL